MSFVLDASVTLAWCFKDETDARAAKALGHLSNATCVAPSIWGLEVGNALLVAERRGRVSAGEVAEVVDLLRELRIDIDPTPREIAFGAVLSLARAQKLSAYDSAYLELALRLGLPLATLDTPLAEAAERLGVDLFHG